MQVPILSAKNTNVAALVAIVALATLFSLQAKSATPCKVTDPTGTPLNVRNRPNGLILGTLPNGKTVYIRDRADDDQGRPWVFLTSAEGGRMRTLGWVFREFISCY
jgi:hypothetical protein